ncbi:MAG TPA: hypothetical protein VK645_03530 [Chitinophagaceae bacterium]|nr:hypothetical protein [Chitinophagaceae bacterium]
MKRILLYNFLAIVLLASCRKSDNPKLPALIRVPVPLITKDASGNASIDGNAPNAFTGKMVVDLYFKNDVKPAKFDIVVIKNGNDSIVKTIQAGVTSFPTSITITGLQLATLFGSPIVLGDKFEIGADVTTQDGQKFEAFPLSGEGYGTSVAAQPGASTSITYAAVCPFDINDFTGNFKTTVDVWNDFGIGVTIPITKVSPSKVSFISPVNGLPIVIDINTTTYVTSVASQPYGDYKAAGIDLTWTYGIASIVSITSTKNFVDPCTKVISIGVIYTVAVGQFTDGGGPLVLEMKKQ